MPGVTSKSPPPVDIASHLPLKLIKSEIVPPAPNQSKNGSEPVIDWLLDFAGCSWIAYGASSLLVISHFPNPQSQAEAKIGPIFRQVLELAGSCDGDGCVSAISWSPVEPSAGELGAALDKCILLFSYNSGDTSSSSFCWSQTIVLSQTTKVEAIKWTGSGDGIISGGIEVVFWRRNVKSWEIAWKFRPKVPQALISATWSVQGLSATAPYTELNKRVAPSLTNEAKSCGSLADKYVLICQGDGHFNYMQAELHHPMPVQMIQWRPSTGKPSNRHAIHVPRSVLLTCSLDGAVRLWSEIDAGRIKRAGKDGYDHRSQRLSFCVIGVIEVNQTLNGSLGCDIFVCWAAEVDSILLQDEACHSCLNNSQCDDARKCEWLIGLGPGRVTTLWAVHCLDDFAPVRFPRITLWMKQEFSSGMETRKILAHKVFMTRNLVSGPPVACSLVQLLPCNSLTWIQLYFQTRTAKGNSASQYHTENPMPSQSNGSIKVDGHTGKLLQIVVHPSILGVELAASLDRDGMLLFWSFSTFFNSHIGLPTSTPSWKLYGKILFSERCNSPSYTCLCWASTVLQEDRVLLLGHSDGIDCFILKTLKSDEKNLSLHKLCSIPFRAQGHEQRLSRISSIPLHPNCNGAVNSSKFLLVALWMETFQAISWEISIHSPDLHGCCFGEHSQVFESDFAGKKYFVSVDPCSSVIPAPHDDDKVTSCSVVSPNDLIVSLEHKLDSANEWGGCNYAYQMMTGCVNGSLKLWRSLPARSLGSGTNWDLVGVFSSGQGSITAVTPSPCYRKIATASPSDQQNCYSILCIWECVHIQNAGSFILEDKLCFDGEIVALNWLTTGNGQLLLGVCLQNEVRVYAMRRCGHQNIMTFENPLGRNIWNCIAGNSAASAIRDFFWGPRGTIIVVHDQYFSLFSQFLLLADKEFLSECCLKFCQDGLFSGGVGTLVLLTNESKEPLIKFNEGQHQFSSEDNVRDDTGSSGNAENCKQVHDIFTKIWFWSMSEIAEHMGGSLPLFHPQILFTNISSGNLTRAFVALHHLVKEISSSCLSRKRYSANVPCNMISPRSLSSYLEGSVNSRSNDSLFQWSSSQPPIELSKSTSSWGYNDPNFKLTSSSPRSEFVHFLDALEQLHNSGCMTKIETMQALSLVDLLQEISDPQSTSTYASLDDPGRRFWVAVRFQQLFFSRRCNRLPLAGELDVSSELIGWAYHSDCQENLFDSLLSAEPSWDELRSLGVGFWYTNATQLRLKMELLARWQYMRNKDPKACSLLYIALNRVQVLAGLFKMSKDDKDKPLAGFLLRNFQEDNNKAAALKNAYVLMGKHQLELAVAFFLLGGDLSSAVTVCAKNLGDEQLALVICRLIEGYGGPLEHNLISKFLLPSALSKGNNWMASVLEWVLGNHFQSFLRMLGVEMTSDISVLSSMHSPFLDPSIGQYCMMLATKTSMKNAVGEYQASVLNQLAVLMNTTSLSRCGLPLEALECHSSSVSLFGSPGQVSTTQSTGHNLLVELLKSPADKHFINWISGEISCQIISHSKLNLAMQYMSNLLTQHPSSADAEAASFRMLANYQYLDQEFEKLLDDFHCNFTSAAEGFQQKFLLNPLHLICMAVLYFHHSGLEFIGYNILHEYMLKMRSDDKGHADDFLLHPIPSNLLLKASEEVSCIFAKFVVLSCVNCCRITYLTNNCIAGEARSCWLAAWAFSNQGITWSFGYLTAMLRLFLRSHTKEFEMILFNILAFVKYTVFFSSAWLHWNPVALLVAVKPILNPLMRGNASNKMEVEELNALLNEIVVMLAHDSPYVQLPTYVDVDEYKEEQDVGSEPSAPEDKRWRFLSTSLWANMVKFLEHQLDTIPKFLSGISSNLNSNLSKPDDESIQQKTGSLSSTLVDLLKLTRACVSFYCSRQFVIYLLQEASLSDKPILSWLENVFSQSELDNEYNSETLKSIELLHGGGELSAFKKLWHIYGDWGMRGAFEQEYCNWLPYVKQKSSTGWGEVYTSISTDESDDIFHKKDRLGSPTHAVGSPLAYVSSDDHPFKSFGEKDVSDMKKAIPFQNPKDTYRRNGELLEALCINSVDHCQAAVSSSKKGIIFFNWEDGLLRTDKSEYLWGEVDWPHDGWAGSESTPIPTCVSPGVGLGSKKGIHLGLGGSTIGAGAMPRANRDITGGGAFGIPGYAGMGTSGLGWGVQDGFDEFVDPPATVDNVRSSALASHPSRPLFMVGSSNTHLYLWEFGKEKAIATYGVLPAANVPPPYALASVCAVRFDRCGHRFATAALDGTVCTWQLEVGGKSNIRPTESSSCFSNHTSDVTYVTASGSIIAACGYSSSGVNVVVWDTLAPPATSRASIMCHEGGARSLSVFDNDIGSGSISPLILTGGKEGDVGLHDFRYIATGKSKRHKHLDTSEHNINASSLGDMRNKTGDQNRNGMLWYIPKAHSGSVTKITTIPNTSFFLTGSKDGDVKLWDAKMAKLVFHWPRLHERHTFLQPSSRGFGGVVRAGVTDIQVVPQGFLTCGGDGLVKFVQLQDFRS